MKKTNGYKTLVSDWNATDTTSTRTINSIYNSGVHTASSFSGSWLGNSLKCVTSSK